jgi:nitrate reductase delta subunit
MKKETIVAGYRLIAELFVNPSQRIDSDIALWLNMVKVELPEVAQIAEQFLALDSSLSSNEYVSTLELSPPCPLYLGTHLFEEPSTCSGISTSPRNAYMLELGGVYEHFGFDLGSIELPDFLPVMLEFAALSIENEEIDTIGLRKRFLEKYLRLGIRPLSNRLEKFKSDYRLLMNAIEILVNVDLQRTEDQPMWEPPDEPSGKVPLPILTNNSIDDVIKKCYEVES